MLNHINSCLYYVRSLREKLIENQQNAQYGLPIVLRSEYMKGSESALDQCNLIETQLLQLQAEEKLRADSVL